jgi:hypothetical protein
VNNRSSVSFFPVDTPEEKKFRKILFFISIVALLIRGVCAFEMACAGNGVNNMLQPLPTSDLATYMKLGREISQGKLPEVFYYQPFYYAVFLPVIYFICGPMEGYLHADFTDTIYWANASLESGKIFDPEFRYAALLPFSANLWFTPLIAVFGVSMTTQVIGMSIFAVIFALSLWFM